MKATLSVLGLYHYDPTIFNNIHLPQGVDRTVLVQNLIFELAGLEVLYPSAPFMADMINLWSSKELPIWERLYNAMFLEYNPIENYDRIEEWTDNRTDNRTTEAGDTVVVDGQTQNSGAITHTTTNRTLNHTVTNMTTENIATNRQVDHKVVGYNDNTLVPHSQDLENGSLKDIQNGTTTDTENGVVTDADSIKQEVDNTTTRNASASEDITGNTIHKGRVHGNIGVTTSQQMLASELALVPQLNIINYIISSFKNRFCILVY